MLDPELADALVGMGERESTSRFGMREERRVEVQAQAARLGPIDPTREMFGRQFVPLDGLAPSLSIHRMQIDAMRAGDQRQRLGQIAAEFIAVASLTGVVPGRGQTAVQLAAAGFESAAIVALPAMDGHRNRRERRNGRVDIDPNGSVLVLGQFQRLSDVLLARHLVPYRLCQIGFSV